MLEFIEVVLALIVIAAFFSAGYAAWALLPWFAAFPVTVVLVVIFMRKMTG